MNGSPDISSFFIDTCKFESATMGFRAKQGLSCQAKSCTCNNGPNGPRAISPFHLSTGCVMANRMVSSCVNSFGLGSAPAVPMRAWWLGWINDQGRTINDCRGGGSSKIEKKNCTRYVPVKFSTIDNILGKKNLNAMPPPTIINGLSLRPVGLLSFIRGFWLSLGMRSQFHNVFFNLNF